MAVTVGWYECVGCGRRFHRMNGPDGGACPHCGSEYLRWLDWKKFVKGAER